MVLARNITGKDMRRVRHEVFRSMPQHKFARLLSEKTGEKVSAKDVARLENHGERDAASPQKPTLEISQFISQFLESSDCLENKGQNTDIGVGMISRKDLKKIVDAYKDMGFASAKGETAQERIASIKASIRAMESDLIGTSKEKIKLSPELADLHAHLRELEEEEVRIDEQIESLKDQLEGADAPAS